MGTFFFGAKSLARKAMPEEAAKSVAEARRRNVAEGSLQKTPPYEFRLDVLKHCRGEIVTTMMQ